MLAIRCVIIPCHNGVNYLAEAVAGILRQGMAVEIIVVDDASTDGTAELAQRLPCRVIRHETTRGQIAGKNTGLKAAQGQYVLFHDHDDVMTEGALAEMYAALISDQDLYLVMAKARDFYSPELGEDARRQLKIKEAPYHGVLAGAVLMRRSLFDMIGYFDEQLKAGEIIELMSKIAALPQIKHIKMDIVASNRRLHAENYGRTNTDREYKDYLKILRANLRR